MNRTKGILIDIGIEIIIAFLLCLGIYFGYEWFHISRGWIMLIFILCIPLFWGNILFSICGKNTIGQRFVNRKKKNQ